MSDFTIILICIASLVFLVFLAFIIRLIKDNIKIDELKELYLNLDKHVSDLRFELYELKSDMGIYDDEEEERY